MNDPEVKIEHQKELLQQLRKEKDNAQQGIQFMKLYMKEEKEALMYPFKPVQLYEEQGVKMVKCVWSYSGIPQSCFSVEDQKKFNQMRRQGIMTENFCKINIKKTTLHLLISIMEDKLSDDIILRIRELCLQNMIKVELKDEYHKKIFNNFVKFPIIYTIFLSNVSASISIDDFCEQHWLDKKQVSVKKNKNKQEEKTTQDLYITFQTLSSYQQALKHFTFLNFDVNPSNHNDKTGELLNILEYLYEEVKKQSKDQKLQHQHQPNEMTSPSTVIDDDMKVNEEKEKGFTIPVIKYGFDDDENVSETASSKKNRDNPFISVQMGENSSIPASEEKVSHETLVYMKEFYEIFQHLHEKQLCKKAQITYQSQGPKSRLTHNSMKELLKPFYEKYQHSIETNQQLNIQDQIDFNSKFNSQSIINFLAGLVKNEKLNIDNITKIDALKQSNQQQQKN